MIITKDMKKIINAALREDIKSGDITTKAVIEKSSMGRFNIIAKSDCIICGVPIASEILKIIDKRIEFVSIISDGGSARCGDIIAVVRGHSRSILTAERTVLNFIGWLSGISTLTYAFAEKVKDTNARIFDTRKTIPSLREFQKYAVYIGGGKNHRIGLYDQVLIKDNHLALVSNDKEIAVKEALYKVKRIKAKGLKIEIEVEDLNMLKSALVFEPDIIMLDNMEISDIQKAVKMRDEYIKDKVVLIQLEVSGNVKLDNVCGIARTGVERISIGALTHSAQSIDLSMDLVL